MTTVSQPNVSGVLTSDVISVPPAPHRLTLVGQKLAAGTLAAGYHRTVPTSTADIASQVGAGSMLAEMIRVARNVTAIVPIDIIVLEDNGSGVAATKTITAASGSASASGSIAIAIGGAAHRVDVAYTLGDDQDAFATAVAAAITAEPTRLVSAVAASGVVTLTALNAGTVGNGIGIQIIGTVPGIALTLADGTPGSVDPVLTTVFDGLEDTQVEHIVWPYSADITTVRTWLDSRFNVQNGVLDGHAFVGLEDTFANVNTALLALNSQNITVFPNRSTDVAGTQLGGSLFEMPYSIATFAAMVQAFRLTPNAVLGQYVISRNGALDSRGGPALASKPLFNTPAPNFEPITIGADYGFRGVDPETIKANGGAIIGNNIGGTSVLLGEVLTTYKTDVAGNTDPTFQYLCYKQTATEIRKHIILNTRARFAQSRASGGDSVQNRDLATVGVVREYFIRLYAELSGADFVLTQRGRAAIRFVEENLTVTLDATTGVFSITARVPIVTQARSFEYTLAIGFDVTTGA